ncbi:MAG: type II secretion system F family protein [Candidatus Woesearchaeota archaeon]
MSFFAEFGKAFVPKKVRPHLKNYLAKAGIYHDLYDFFGMMFFASMILTFIVFWLGIYPAISPDNLFVLFLVIFGSVVGLSFAFIGVLVLIFYFMLDVKIYRRTQQIETILPDYLQVVSTNVKSGLSLEKSLWFAIKPSFGIMALEMEIVLKRVMAGQDLGEALTALAEKYDSPSLKRAMSLIVGEIDSGGSISHVLDGLVTNLKTTQRLKAELSASVITYMIFIGAIVVIIAPGLFSLAFNLLIYLKTFVGSIAASGAAGGGAGPVAMFGDIDPDAINLELFERFSIVTIFMIALFSSMIVSMIEKGNVKGGLKYIPVFTIGSFLAYILFRIVLGSIFGGML